MSLAIVHSRAQVGVEAPPVTVEVHLSSGLPALTIVGMPETAVKESKDRVRSALINAGFEFPAGRLTVNLAPADLPKEGGRYDLPIALGILVASGQLPAEALAGQEYLGELALSGGLRAVRGVLPAAMQCSRAGRSLLLPQGNAAEAALVDTAEVFGARSLLEACQHLLGVARLTAEPPPAAQARTWQGFDLADVRGQPQAKRALEVAAAGAHNLLLVGPPGSGKTMLASRLPGILPPLTVEERLAVAAIHSVAGLGGSHWPHRPYRAPHHSASAAALVGGGGMPRPGEISLAHHGVLFLDELPEFSRQVLEVLREPLESGEILLSRAARQVRYPARFQLVAAMNPCPCGYQGDAQRCHCSLEQVRRYQQRISGPLLDRMDLHVEVPALDSRLLTATDSQEESSEQVAQRVMQARRRQQARRGKANSALTVRELEADCALQASERQLMETALTRLGLSARAYHRVLKVARTLADLAGEAAIARPHLMEALNYRKLERQR